MGSVEGWTFWSGVRRAKKCPVLPESSIAVADLGGEEPSAAVEICVFLWFSVLVVETAVSMLLVLGVPPFQLPESLLVRRSGRR